MKLVAPRPHEAPVISLLVALAAVATMVATFAPVPAYGADPEVASERWVRHGFAEAWALDAADTNGDGIDEVVYGGRGVALVDDRTLVSGQPRWSFKWDDVPGNVLTGGDNMWTTGIEMVDATGDGVPDPMLTTSDSSAYVLDGVTGEKVWRAPTDGGLSNGFALIDADSDDVPDLFPSGSSTVLSGRTGEQLWEAPIPKNARTVGSGDFDGDGKRDAIITINPPGAGTNPNTIVPALTATTVFVVSSQGELLYDFKPYNGIESMVGADIDGDGAEEAVLGSFNGILYVIGPGGIRWTSFLGPSAITALQAADTDGDGRDEIFAATGRGALGAGAFHEVVSFGPEGGQRWRHMVPDPVKTMQLTELDGDTTLELLVGGGTKDSAPVGSAIALEAELVAPVREKWRVETAQRVEDFAVLAGGGAKRVAIGSADALLREVDAATGAELGRWTAGGYTETVTAVDLTGDGRDEAITGGGEGHVIVTDAEGDEVWSRTMSGGNNLQVFQVATGDVDADGSREVAAVAEIFDRDDAGQVVLYSSEGAERWALPLRGYGQDVEFADLDADGDDDLVVAEGGPALGDPCAIGGYDGRTGERMWWMELPTCIVIHSDADDVDGDGHPEIGFGTQVLFGAPQAGLLRANGEAIWHLEPPQASAWVDLGPGRFVHGGFADQARGHLTERDLATGEIRWQTFIAGDRGNGGGATRFGQMIPDTTGDGLADIVTSSDSREILLLDGGNGETIWATRIQSADVPVTQAHQAGPLAYVHPDGMDPILFAAQYATGRQLSRTFVLSLQGEILTSFGMEGDAHAATPARFGPNSWGAVVGAGLGTYAFELQGVDAAEPVPTVLTLSVEGHGANRVLRVALASREDGTPVAGRNVQLSADGLSIGSVTTSTDGTAELVAPPRYRGGRHTFEAVFEGDEVYSGSSAQASS